MTLKSHREVFKPSPLSNQLSKTKTCRVLGIAAEPSLALTSAMRAFIWFGWDADATPREATVLKVKCVTAGGRRCCTAVCVGLRQNRGETQGGGRAEAEDACSRPIPTSHTAYFFMNE